MKNITYLLGAGASYNAFPIWKEQAEKMVEMSLEYQANHDFDNCINPFNEDNQNFILWEIGYFGKKAIDFKTIDTYAKKLWLNGSIDELDRLKFAVSMFFTLWQLSTDLKIRNKERYGDVIDKRYIDLLGKLLEKGEPNPIIPFNINIVTWNYDLQFEFAYKSFCDIDRSWREIKYALKFTTQYQDSLQICHLNGYHGFYSGSRGETGFLDRSKGKTFNDILKSLSFIPSSIHNETIHFYDHINYAWEKNDLSTSRRKRAKNIFSETDILIIIGYSFPPVNKEIDEDLFDALRKDKLEIIYQDPSPDENFLKHLIDTSKIKITYPKDRKDHFHFPY